MSLVVDSVSFAYRAKGGHFHIDNWSAGFPAGQVTALTGPSGCGKSTRLYLLGLLLRLRQGTITLDGRRVDNLADQEASGLRARKYGFVFQDAALDPSRTVLDNVTEVALYAGLERVSARRRGLELMDRLGVDVPAHRRPGQISGGQAQRIALCRALIGHPSVVLADEPTGNLDPTTTENVLACLREQADDGAVVVVVTHDPKVATWADAQLILERT